MSGRVKITPKKDGSLTVHKGNTIVGNLPGKRHTPPPPKVTPPPPKSATPVSHTPAIDEIYQVTQHATAPHVHEEVLSAEGNSSFEKPEIFTQEYPDAKSRIKVYLSEIDEGVKSFVTPEGYLEWLQYAGKFSRYSFSNQMLLLRQTDGQVGHTEGYRAWQKLGRHVKKGEKALHILAPVTRKSVTVNNDTGEEEKRVVMVGYRTVSVFDETQTEGDPLPEPYRTFTETPPDGFVDELDSKIREYGYVVEEQSLGDRGRECVTNVAEKRVVVDSDLPSSQKVVVLARELGHIAAGHYDDQNSPRNRRVLAETQVEAESIAYALCREKGMSTRIGGETFGHIQQWSASDPKVMKKVGNNITATLRTLLA